MATVEVTFQRATRAHAEALALSLRAADAAELEACGREPLAALLESVEGSSEAWAMLFDGEVGALFGIGSKLADGSAGCAWCLTGRAVDVHPKAFIRHSRCILEEMLERCPALGNYVDARYAKSVRWLEWMGAEVGPAEPYGPSGALFHPVVFRRSRWEH